MDKMTIAARDIRQVLSVALAAMLFGSTMILSTIGPLDAREMRGSASSATPAAPRYLA